MLRRLERWSLWSDEDEDEETALEHLREALRLVCDTWAERDIDAIVVKLQTVGVASMPQLVKAMAMEGDASLNARLRRRGEMAFGIGTVAKLDAVTRLQLALDARRAGGRPEGEQCPPMASRRGRKAFSDDLSWLRPRLAPDASSAARPKRGVSCPDVHHEAGQARGDSGNATGPAPGEWAQGGASSVARLAVTPLPAEPAASDSGVSSSASAGGAIAQSKTPAQERERSSLGWLLQQSALAPPSVLAAAPSPGGEERERSSLGSLLLQQQQQQSAPAAPSAPAAAAPMPAGEERERSSLGSLLQQSALAPPAPPSLAVPAPGIVGEEAGAPAAEPPTPPLLPPERIDAEATLAVQACELQMEEVDQTEHLEEMSHHSTACFGSSVSPPTLSELLLGSPDDSPRNGGHDPGDDGAEPSLRRGNLRAFTGEGSQRRKPYDVRFELNGGEPVLRTPPRTSDDPLRNASTFTFEFNSTSSFIADSRAYMALEDCVDWARSLPERICGQETIARRRRSVRILAQRAHMGASSMRRGQAWRGLIEPLRQVVDSPINLLMAGLVLAIVGLTVDYIADPGWKSPDPWPLEPPFPAPTPASAPSPEGPPVAAGQGGGTDAAATGALKEKLERLQRELREKSEARERELAAVVQANCESASLQKRLARAKQDAEIATQDAARAETRAKLLEQQLNRSFWLWRHIDAIPCQRCAAGAAALVGALGLLGPAPLAWAFSMLVGVCLCSLCAASCIAYLAAWAQQEEQASFLATVYCLAAGSGSVTGGRAWGLLALAGAARRAAPRCWTGEAREDRAAASEEAAAPARAGGPLSPLLTREWQ